MKRVFDTSAWIELISGTSLGKRLEAELPQPADCIVPTLVQLELSKWLARESSEDKADEAIAYTQTCVVIALDTDLAVLAAEHCRVHRLSTADAIIYATALAHKSDLITCDSHFADLPGVMFFPKNQGVTGTALPSSPLNLSHFGPILSSLDD